MMQEPGPHPVNSNSGITTHRQPQIRWRWYHFYFLLALFDVIVIIASLTLYHRTLRSYEVSLNGLASVDTRQRWITDIRNTVIELNAPGNDVFESRDAELERRRFDQTKTKLTLLMRGADAFEISLDEVNRHVQAMITEEESILKTFESLQTKIDRPRAEARISEATVAMAAMDRHQANAVATLSGIEKDLHDEEQSLLVEYGSELKRSAAFEKYFMATVALILVGVFWYGRKLQRMHEDMILSQQRAIAERHERLASVGEVCSAVAHGIRNPLSGITSSAQLALEYGTLDPNTQLRLRDVLSEAKRLDSRISRLLDFAKGEDQVVRTPLDLRDALAQAVDEMRATATARGVDLKYDRAAQALIVDGCHEELVQSIIELISNALEHTPAEGHVTVTLSRSSDDRHAIISIRDTGKGIPENIRDHVFDLFFTTRNTGNGIGLASVKRTIESHHGTIAIANPDEGGTIVNASLPLKPSRFARTN